MTSRSLDRVHTRLTSGFGIREPDHLYPWVPWASLRICRDYNSTTYRAGKILGLLYMSLYMYLYLYISICISHSSSIMRLKRKQSRKKEREKAKRKSDWVSPRRSYEVGRAHFAGFHPRPTLTAALSADRAPERALCPFWKRCWTFFGSFVVWKTFSAKSFYRKINKWQVERK